MGLRCCATLGMAIFGSWTRKPVLDPIDVGTRADCNKRASMIRPQPPSVAVKAAAARRHQDTTGSSESCRANGYHPVNAAKLCGATYRRAPAQGVWQRPRRIDDG